MSSGAGLPEREGVGWAVAARAIIQYFERYYCLQMVLCGVCTKGGRDTS